MTASLTWVPSLLGGDGHAVETGEGEEAAAGAGEQAGHAVRSEHVPVGELGEPQAVRGHEQDHRHVHQRKQAAHVR